MKKTTATSKRKTARKNAAPSAKNTSAPTPDGTKTDLVLKLLRREQGATLEDLVTATGWQPHSVRGFISGTLRKKRGLTVACTRSASGPAYHLQA